MRYKDYKLPRKVEIPELQILDIGIKVINKASHIKPLYWIICISIILPFVLMAMPYHIWNDLLQGLFEQRLIVNLMLIFSLVAISLVWSVGQKIDVWVMLFFNMYGKRTPFMDWLMLGITQIGNGAFAGIIVFIVFFIDRHMLAYEIAIGTLTLWFVVELIKGIFHRSRPYIKLKKIRIVGARASGHSFPSGHTSQTFFLAALLLHYFSVNKTIVIIIYMVALLVGITRIYVGMHYPRDVLGGAILGTSWGLIGIFVNSYLGILG